MFCYLALEPLCDLTLQLSIVTSGGTRQRPGSNRPRRNDELPTDPTPHCDYRVRHIRVPGADFCPYLFQYPGRAATAAARRPTGPRPTPCDHEPGPTTREGRWPDLYRVVCRPPDRPANPLAPLPGPRSVDRVHLVWIRFVFHPAAAPELDQLLVHIPIDGLPPALRARDDVTVRRLTCPDSAPRPAWLCRSEFDASLVNSRTPAVFWCFCRAPRNCSTRAVHRCPPDPLSGTDI
jgi:hypothetical protein